MSRKSAESLSHPIDRKYSDLWSQDETQREYTRQARASEILAHLKYSAESDKLQFQTFHGKPLLEIPVPQAVCDIGSGLGGVTLAYRKLLPETPIVSVDHDARAREAAETVGATAFIQADVTCLSDSEWQRLATSVTVKSLDHIVALKTRGEVILKLLELWEQKAVPAILFMSMIEESDRDVVEEVKSMISKLPQGSWLRFSLHDFRDYHEVAWVILPQYK